jgi:hypothetical protein
MGRRKWARETHPVSIAKLEHVKVIGIRHTSTSELHNFLRILSAFMYGLFS